MLLGIARILMTTEGRDKSYYNKDKFDNNNENRVVTGNYITGLFDDVRTSKLKAQI